MFKLTALSIALTLLVTLIHASPVSMEERSPPSLRCAPSSHWSNGTLSFMPPYTSGDSGDLAIRTFTNSTTGKTERRLTKWSANSGLPKLTHVSLEYCNSTTFNYTYYLPQPGPFEHNNPLRIRLPGYGIPSGYGYDYPACLGIGSSAIGAVPTNPHNGHLRTTGTWPISVQECQNTDFQQSALTQAQFFQQIYKFAYITTANGKANPDDYGNPPQVWNLELDHRSQDIYVTSAKQDNPPVFFLNASYHT
ncbi:unnamed protein product [Sympodiomycopsis kandeliae]